MDLSIILKIFLIIILLLGSALFVMAEFSLVKLRPTRVQELAKTGDKNSKLILHMLDNLDNYLSACQLGITIVSLGLGWVGESTFHALLHPVFDLLNLNPSISHTISFVFAFSLMTLLHVVLGELVPKTMAIQAAEKSSYRIARPLYIFYKIMKPFIWALNGLAGIIINSMGYSSLAGHGDIHSEQELRTIMQSSRAHGQINDNEYRYVERVFEFDNKIAKEVMTPRTEVEAIDLEDSLAVISRQMKQEEYTRYPVIRDGDKDDILGILNVKKLLFADKEITESSNLEEFISPAIKVFEHTPISQVLKTIKQTREHMIIITDEYGGTSGILTLEDIVEELTGEIRDEFDDDEQSLIKKLKNGHYLVDGWVPIQDINSLFSINLPHEEVDTIGAYIYLQKYEYKVGATYLIKDVNFKVLTVEENQIRQIEIWKD
ncbi:MULTISPECIES: hemolysin family protein [unclassified Gemella]|uniref:hemolysin family protein n=1 Tax=unclassified Gemella TaxID=2624949 RepID=UPI0010738BC5|nr:MULTISPECIES: hemolysin family protein [unclassified Gemella]MBF0710554.1 HlyC/CorC family transporter [Gemella sp. GL1.1]MBF0746277.1 HlyC/CorC family transporter [Gemella sp. 19428wG2_WT2a]NYS27898.1 HlyC/CorC family transporter [Gemella sp. GL1]TFU60555.1 HlyC/CorC family transporter [Gemella sp. WT2a]